MSLESSKQGTEDTVGTGSVHTKTASPIHKEPYHPLKMDDPGESKKYHGISTLPIDRLACEIDHKLQELEPLVKDDVKNKVRNLREDFKTMYSHVYGFSSDDDHFDAFEMFRKLDVLETLVNEDIRPKVKDIKEALERMYDRCYDITPKVEDIEELKIWSDMSYASERYETPGQTISDVLFNVQRNRRQLQRDISGLDKKLDDVLIRMSSLTDEQQNKSQVDRKEGLIHSLYIQPGLTPDQSPAKSDAEEGNTIDKKPTDRRKAEWTIDPQAWNYCIRSKDSSQIDALLRMKKIPNNNLLSEAKNTFHIKYVRNICDGICQYIVQKSYDIRHVYPAIKMDESRDRSQESITFVVIHGKHTNIDNIEFKLHIKRTGDFVYNDHDSMKEREKEREIFDEENDVELLKLANCLREHSQRLMKGHTNICRISCSETKSVRYGKDDELVPRAHCITIYVYAKGLIPLGEDMLPKTLIFEGYEALVDVQEGFVELYAGNEGPYDNLNHLRIGCSIGGDPHLNKENLHGTLGGFFDYAGKEFCMSSAHVFLTAWLSTPRVEREKLELTCYQY